MIMCGIVGLYSKNDIKILENLVEGINFLSYRGYDSSGIAIKELDGSIFCRKSKGDVSQLEASLVTEFHQSLESILSTKMNKMGIAHTRWASHGKPADNNAHPHSDQDDTIYLVHNGVISNYKPLKEHLIEKNHSFYGETDSEVIVKLISEYRKTNTMQESIFKTINELEGTFALLIIHRLSNSMYAVCKNQDMYMGQTDSGYTVFASDQPVISTHTKKIIILDKNLGHVVKINEHGINHFDFDQNKISLELLKHNILECDIEQIMLNGHPTMTHKEIFEQPLALKKTLGPDGETFYRLDEEGGNVNLGGLEHAHEKLLNIKGIVLTAEGTSYNACLFAQEVFGRFAGGALRPEIITSSTLPKSTIDLRDKLLIGVSQSGSTLETLLALKEGYLRGAYRLGVTNGMESTLATTDTDAGIYCHIGYEMGVASTKAFTSQCLILIMIAIYLGRQRNLSQFEAKLVIAEMKKVPSLVEQVLNQEESVKLIALSLCEVRGMYVMGNGLNYATAEEGALKIKELSYIQAEAYSGSSMKHGPLAVVDKTFPSIMIAPHDRELDDMRSAIEQIHSRGGPLIIITSEDTTEFDNLIDYDSEVIHKTHIIKVPVVREEFYPILCSVVLQLLAYWITDYRSKLADENGNLLYLDINIDHPRNLAKVVTVK
jgi:glutamine---fructose-6-phosphate transaminase (isomerizing)